MRVKRLSNSVQVFVRACTLCLSSSSPLLCSVAPRHLQRRACSTSVVVCPVARRELAMDHPSCREETRLPGVWTQVTLQIVEVILC